MFQRAVTQGWRLPDDQIQQGIELAHEVLSDPDATDRERIAAAKLIVAMGTARQRDAGMLDARNRPYKPR